MSVADGAAGNGHKPVLVVDDIHTYYGSIEALKGISLEVNEGEIVHPIAEGAEAFAAELAISFGLVFGGAIFIERIFNYPGLGMLLFASIGARDFSMMSGSFLIITAAVIVANILADLLYSFIDPRVRRQT